MPNLAHDSETEVSNLKGTASPPNPAPPARRSLLHFLQAILICFVALTMLGASDPATRFDRLGHQLMCTCGCGEILLECNHVGCPVSAPMITELHNQLGAGLGNRGILAWFTAKYGPVVLAAPIRGGFDLVAWIMPFAVLALGLLALFYFARLWKGHHAATVLAQSTAVPSPNPSGLRDRIRRETTFEP